MAPAKGSNLKRGLPPSVGEEASDLKKVRRSERLSSQNDDRTPVTKGALPSPLTHQDSTTTEAYDHSKEATATPPSQTDVIPSSQYISPSRSTGFNRLFQYSPQHDTQTQPFSQFLPPLALTYEVEDEEAEGVWGYMVPIDRNGGDPLVLKHRDACPKTEMSLPSKKEKKKVPKSQYTKQEDEYEKKKVTGLASSGYLIGRHPECDRIIGSPTVSNRHCLLFPETTSGTTTAILEDLSGNGTFVNDQLVGRNKRRQLQDGDEISILGEARYCFRYPRNRESNGFRQQYTIQEQLGKGHFASVYLCVEKSTGMRYAVKKFEKRAGPGERSKIEGLQQEIAVLMGVSHPNLLCLKDTFDEDDGVYLVLELAPEGELFNYIVMKQKLSEAEARKVFVQLFQAVKYLHERNIVHRDIKPENILLCDKELTVKLADFGLAKIIGEESFTTTLCGTPSYVAPEILQSSNHRRYTRAVDIWSLGVVLYICLCGFPPFSDELYDPVNNPYTLAQQILGGRFDYPSPYWDSVGDPALDLIDRMLTVDPDKRITIDGCLEHPWTTGREIPPTQLMNSMDSTDGLVGQLTQLDFSRRKPVRERTLLSAINDITVSRVVDAVEDQDGNTQAPVKIFEKNKGGHAGPSVMSTNGLAAGTGGKTQKNAVVAKEETPAHHRNPDEFMAMGGKGDQVLFAEDEGSNYVSPEKLKDVNRAVAEKAGTPAGGQKKKGKK
ncbi:uncharacterized protein PV09_05420 [Verruconis gallopava]|uniref:Uncharacterized protein n=1 Tax=Verruconis gallopava TaxID=253628 RepID=A0A0D2AVL9_9PEZI|nr:uncharacterized protein PV09_05420 [Verruconis gallopava]KIW03194.1 hypothetical protein PV09_05420 [Verruconis gallopava]